MTRAGRRIARALAAVAFGAALLAVDGAAFAVLLRDGEGWLFALGHGAASLGAAVLWWLLPVSYRRGPEPSRRRAARRSRLSSLRARTWLGCAVLVLIALLLPVLGLLGLLVAVLPALHRPIVARVRDWRTVVIPPLPLAPDVPEPGRVAELRPLTDVLVGGQADVDERMDAVLGLRHVPARAAVPILRQALGDPVDDVRLLAYAMLYRRDNALQLRIQAQEQALAQLDRERRSGRTEPAEETEQAEKAEKNEEAEKTEKIEDVAGDQEAGQDRAAAGHGIGAESDAERAARHYALAQALWELCYSNLAAGAVQGRVLGSAETHARAALDRLAHLPEAAASTLSTRFLLGRILLGQGRLDDAERILDRAEADGFA
ncbi:MAG: hypothetical protein AAGC55_19780, partial [Myxococcota bacterium]